MRKCFFILVVFILFTGLSTRAEENVQRFEIKLSREFADQIDHAEQFEPVANGFSWSSSKFTASVEKSNPRKSEKPALTRALDESKVLKIERIFQHNPARAELHRKYGLDLHYHLIVANEQDAETIIQNFQGIEEITHIQEAVMASSAEVFPNDAKSGQQWGLDNFNRPGTDIQAYYAWEITKGDPRVVVAIIDNCVDISHEDLQHNRWINPNEIPGNGIDDDENGCIDDVYGWNFIDDNNNVTVKDIAESHGTHVAGIVGAHSNNGIGIAGVAGGWGEEKGASLMNFRAGNVNSNGETIIGGGYKAMVYAADNGANIAQCSWSSDKTSMAGEDAVYYFTHEANGTAMKGGIVIAAAGNQNTVAKYYPAAYNDVLAVTSIQKDGTKSSFSNYGDWTDITAPGTEIYSTMPDDGYNNKNGTSMACPMVSGVAALVLSAVYDLIPQEKKTVEWLTNILKESVTKLPNLDESMGAGLVNAQKAIDLAMKDNPANTLYTTIDDDGGLVVYPNPVNDELRITNYELRMGDAIEIYDMTGKCVYVAKPNSTSSIVNSTFTVNVSHLPAGTYIVKIGNRSAKVVKL